VWLTSDWLLDLTLSNPDTLFDGNPGLLTSTTTVAGTGIARIVAAPGALGTWSPGVAPLIYVQYLVFSPTMSAVGAASQMVFVPVVP
jgi:hypothetical protein